MPTDEPPGEDPPAETPAPEEAEAAKARESAMERARRWYGQGRDYVRRSPVVVAAVAALIVGFGGGLVVGKTGAVLPNAPALVQEGKSGQAWPLFGKPRDAGAARRGIPKPDGFAVWRTRLDTSGETPLACIQMSRPLDASKAYGDYVMVSPDPGSPPAVSVKGDELCVGGLGFTDSRITLLKGLPARGGDKLDANADVDFTFGEKPPYVGFAGDGVILPREDADGVGIETINVTRLEIEVWRVPDRNLVRRSIVATDPTPEGQWPDDWSDTSPDDEGRVVWKGQVAVKGDPGARTTTVFPLGAVLKEMKPGAYVIKARDASGGRGLTDEENSYDSNPPAQARRWVVFTDMALIAYTGSEALDVVVRSLESAKVEAGVRVALVAANGEDLAEARTDSTGRVRFARPLLEGKGAGRAKMVMAYGDTGDLAVLDLDRSPADLSKQGIAGRNAPAQTSGRETTTAIDGYLYLDRGIYRPGETVRLTAMIRDREARAVKDRKGALVVRRPSGVEYKRYRFDGAPDGAVTASVELPKSAPRGRWTARLEMEGIEQPSGEVSFQVEDFAPQRLAVTATAHEDQPLTAGERRRIDVSARFLYGAAGAGLQTQGEARLTVDTDPFPAYEDYQWGDEKEPFEAKYLDLESTVTDGQGEATLLLSADEAGETAQPLKAAVTASVFEPGGRPVREGVTLKVRTKPVYYGVKVSQTEGRGEPTVTLEVIAVDANGQRVASGASYTLISENWDYDWFQQDGRWQWRRTSRDAVVQKDDLDIAAAKAGRVSRKLGWGDYRLVVEGPHGARSVIRFAAGWGAPAEDAEAPDLVRVSAGPGTHVQGDTVSVTIKAPYAGEAQVAVATDHVIDFQTLKVPEEGATVRLRTSGEWGGGAYVMVTVVQPRDPVDSPKPRRALGVAYVPLDPRGRKLDIELGVPEKIGSHDVVEVPVAVRGLGIAQRAHVTVAAVDEGILQLTRFQSPDPVKWYFGKRALTVDYRDDYGRLLDPNLGPPANVNFGGGDSIGGEGLTVTPIKTVALWSGVVETGLDGKARIRLPAADYNGELRVMAVAWTDQAVGSASKAMTVREPVVADLNLPRFLAPGDKPVATLELHNLDGRAGDYAVDTTSSGGVVMAIKKVITLAVGQRIAEHIPFLAPSRAGLGTVGFKVKGPGFTTTKDYPIQTRLGWSPVTRTYTALQKPGESFTPPASMMAGLAAGSVTMQVSYSPFRGFDPAPIAQQLSQYPYGCTEQLVSAAYPLLYAAEVSDDPKAKRSSAALNGAVGRLLDRQTLDGAFGLWRVGDGEADAWLGAYATDFLVEAQRRGAPVPQAAMDRALDAMRQISLPEGWTSISYRIRYPDWWGRTEAESKKATERLRSRASAYALYVLAKAGKGDLARLRWWHDVQMKSEASPLAKAQVAAGLSMMGDHARARSAFRQAVRALGYKDDTDWYQSPLRDLAAVIALAREAGEPQIAEGLEKRLEGAVKDPDALNTQEEARLLQAAHFMLAAAGPMKIEATGAYALKTAAGAPRWGVGKLAAARFVNKGSGALWRTVTVTGSPVEAPGREASGVSVDKTLYTFTGGLADPGSLTQGERVIVRLSGRSMQARAMQLVIDDPLPAGWEIETVLGPDDAQDGPFRFLGTLTGADIQEARDDRYVAAMDLGGNKDFAVAYIARAVTPGDYFLPGPEAKDMYRPSVSARGSAGRTVIVPSP